MSKLSFRARALDANKSLPVYHAKDIPDLPDIASVNRVVPQMPTGMEKEEETEHHLQRAISAQQIYGEAQRLIIPTPDAILYDADYKKIKKDNVHMPKQFIHVQAFSLEDELPDYDCDEDDIQWVDEYNKNNTQHALTHLEFEKFIDIIEKGCCLRIEMFSLSDCQALLQKDEKLVKEIYDYWKRKRKEQDNIALTPLVCTEKKDGNAFHDPYVAFRRRIEKMQTRKNRKNDEASYEKMLRLRKDLNRACLILEMVKLREQKKRNLLQTTISILEKRYSNRDYNGELLRQCYNLLKQQHYQQQAHQPNDASSHNNNNSSKVPNVERLSRVDSFEERLKKSSQLDDGQRRHKMMKQKSLLHSSSVDGHKSQESNAQANSGQVRLESEVHDGPDGKFTFRRKKDVIYHAPRYDSMGNWPWTHPVEGGTAGSHFCYCYTSVNERKKCVGFARRRVGRGGRSYFDRAYSPYDRNSNSSVFLDTPTTCNNDMPTFQDRVPPWPHFKPNCDLHNSDDSDTNDNNEHKYTWNQWCTTSNTMLHDERKEISSAQKRRRLHSISKLKRLQPYTNRTSLQQFSSSINNQTFLASVSSRYSKSNSPNWLPYKHRKLSQTGDINCSTPTKKTSNILSPPRPASVAPASSIYQLNFPIKVDKSRTKESKSDVPRSSKKSSSKHAKSVPTQPVQTSVATSVNSTQGSSSVSSQVTASSVAGQQPIISRQPLSIVQQQSYIMQKVVQNHNGGNSLQISAIPTQPMNLVRTGNKLSISRGLNISHAPVSNGMTPSSAGIQLITR